MTDTPALTAEQRAAKVVEDFKASDHVFGPDGATPLMESLIAAAITEAEDAKLERVAAAFDCTLPSLEAEVSEIDGPGRGIAEGIRDMWLEIPKDIRKFKTKEN